MIGARTLAAAALLATACAPRDAAPPKIPAADSARGASAEEARAAVSDEWNKAEVMKRLKEAGLVVTDSGRSVTHAGLHAAGVLLTVSGSTLELYIYPSAEARKRDSAALDTLSAPTLPAAERPRYIVSGNLVAIHFTPKDVIAERVENVLTARHAGAP